MEIVDLTVQGFGETQTCAGGSYYTGKLLLLLEHDRLRAVATYRRVSREETKREETVSCQLSIRKKKRRVVTTD